MKRKKKQFFEELKPQKEKRNELKKTQGMVIARIILWGMLLFIFARGVISCLEPSDAKQVEQTIENFKRDFAGYKGDNEEIMAFAQNFAKEYLTYYEQDKEGYKARIRPYVSDRLYSMSDSLISFQESAKATYVAAYRKEQYSQNQYDVYVAAEINYGNVIDTTTLRIPIYARGGAYIVESIPMVVTDSLLLASFKQNEYAGTPVTEAELVSIRVSMENFMKAYYEENADILEYYLSSQADRSRFTGLYGRYKFVSLDDLKCYREPGREETIAIANVTIEDADNGNRMKQEYNLTVVNENGRFYIKDINTKTKNLN